MWTAHDPYMATLAENDLRKQIQARTVIVIAGAGVSLSTTNGSGRKLAGWKGLLLDGSARCETVIQPPLTKRWGSRVRGCINSNDLDELLAAAQQIQRKLSRPPGGAFGTWLRETVGKLPVADESLIRAIADLGVPIATTNYDGLISNVTKRPPITWQDPVLVEQWSRGDKDAIFHIHGYWEHPETVVLGVSSYEDILRHPATQHFLRTFFTSGRVLFIGFGAGLEDPNFDALLAWHRQVFPGSQYPHFRLVARKEKRKLQNLHGHAGDNITVVCYGEKHADLVPFLQSLCPSGSAGSGLPSAASSAISTLPSDFTEMMSILEMQRAHLTPSDFVDQVSRAASLWWVSSRDPECLSQLGQVFDSTYDQITKDQHITVGLRLVGMLDENHQRADALAVFERIRGDLQELGATDPHRKAAEERLRSWRRAAESGSASQE
jgi:hypothetical protein